MKSSRWVVIASALLPVLLLVGIVYLFLARGTGLQLIAPAPIERLEFERIVFEPDEIQAQVLNAGPEAVTIAQVQVGFLNRASWEFEVVPGPTLPRLGRAVVKIPYPWTPGEPYEIVLITANNLIFRHEIEVAAQTPSFDWTLLSRFSLLGVYVGVIPVFLGIGWLPFLRRLSQDWYFFLLSLTAGLLVFLGVDALEEALENAADVPGPYQGVALILVGTTMSLGTLYAISGWFRERRQPAGSDHGLLLAYMIAFGIGVHNLGEGLAIGGAYALGAVSTGALLVIGFTVHNLTEGVAVIAPVVQSRFRWLHLVWLGLLAGAPTIAGTLLGAFAYTAVWAVLFLAIGAGAVFQVVIEIVRHQVRQGGTLALANGWNVAGFGIGMAIMYFTGLFVAM
ncbi:MAG: ZIP family metal transporter [Acidobacteria bacterium]|nr:ZIP family metal transporter [Acidobacteriota bacterium]